MIVLKYLANMPYIVKKPLIFEGFSMTFSLDRLAHYLLGLVANRAHQKTFPRLDLKTLSERDLADLNLPLDVKNRLQRQDERR